jgi:hypothetical protein
MLTPREIVDTMIAKHGVATSDDISKLREPLSRALTSVTDLANHMDLFFLLASQRLTRSGQGETDYRYFELFLETVSGFPTIALSLPGYYFTCPAILQQRRAWLRFSRIWKNCATICSEETPPLRSPAQPKAAPQENPANANPTPVLTAPIGPETSLPSARPSPTHHTSTVGARQDHSPILPHRRHHQHQYPARLSRLHVRNAGDSDNASSYDGKPHAPSPL